MDRVLKEKSIQMDQLFHQIKGQTGEKTNINMSFDEPMLSMIRKKVEDESPSENHEFNRYFSLQCARKDSQLPENQSDKQNQVFEPMCSPILYRRVDSCASNQIENPYLEQFIFNAPKSNEVVQKMDKNEVWPDTILPIEVQKRTNSIDVLEKNNDNLNKVLTNNFTNGDNNFSKANFVEKKHGNSFSAGSSFPVLTDHIDRSPNEMNSSLVRVKKNSLKESLGQISTNDNVLEYYIDEKGFLVDQNGCPISDESGKPIQLTEENINYMKDHGLYEERCE